MTDIITESDQKHYSVAIPFVDEENLLFQVRSDKLSRQPGDICFPGGAVEDGESPKQAAVRELTEELEITANQISIHEESFLLVNAPAIIHCFPCHIIGYGGSFNLDEVTEVFYVPIKYFENTFPKLYEVEWKPEFPEDFPFDKIYGGKDYGWRKRKSKIRFYEYQGHVIWGMTARILEAFVAGKVSEGEKI